MSSPSYKDSAPATTFGSRTDVGCIREHNEDSLIVAPPLFVVADGMGGHAAGEVASEIAVKTVSQHMPEHPDGKALGKAVEAANHAIIKAALEGIGREGMGTTCTAAMLEGERLVIAQVGDSRAYLLHDGKLQQLTRDHSLVADLIEAGQITKEEARVHPHRSVITRALGSDPNTQPDIYEINVAPGDRLLLCSDGLSGMVMDPGIESIMARTHNPQSCASQLVSAAIQAGGHDNITVIVADVTSCNESQIRKASRKAKRGLAIIALLIALALAGAGFAYSHFVANAAFLAEQNGKVAIYRGTPGTVLGLSSAKLVEVTDISVAELNPGVAERIQAESITCGSVEEAKGLVETYRTQLDDEASSDTASANANNENAATSGESASSAPRTGSGDSASPKKEV